MQGRFHRCRQAYLLEPADTTPIVIDDPQWAGREFMTPDDPDDPASPVTIRREGMAAFFQGKDRGRDACEFCGAVKAVRGQEELESAYGRDHVCPSLHLPPRPPPYTQTHPTPPH